MCQTIFDKQQNFPSRRRLNLKTQPVKPLEERQLVHLSLAAEIPVQTLICRIRAYERSWTLFRTDNHERNVFRAGLVSARWERRESGFSVFNTVQVDGERENTKLHPISTHRFPHNH